jgi:hypothetical protein
MRRISSVGQTFRTKLLIFVGAVGVWRKYSCSSAVVFQQPSQAFLGTELRLAADSRRRPE